MNIRRLDWRSVINVVIAIAAVCCNSWRTAEARTRWWTQAYLGSTTNVTIWSKGKCRDDLEITRQSPACIVDHPDVKPVLHEALREAVKQCAAAFKEHRYNCSINTADPTLFGSGQTRGTHREGAFIQALLGASVAHGIARACSAGLLGKLCTCAVGQVGGQNPDANVAWTWSKCGDDVDYGRRIATALVRKNRTTTSRRRKIHLHNYEAGSLLASQLSPLTCHCYGISGSCIQKNCVVRQPHARTISGKLYRQYRSAVKTRFRQKAGSWKLRLVGGGRPAKSTFVYSEASPNFCRRNAVLGYPGTRGRRCFENSKVADCQWMCCGRGHSTETTTVTRHDCDCKRPVGRTYYKCTACSVDIVKHTCN